MDIKETDSACGYISGDASKVDGVGGGGGGGGGGEMEEQR